MCQAKSRRPPEFDGLRYWRRPVWLIVNYMIADGLKRAGQTRIVQRIADDSLRLIEQSGFAGYFDPVTAEPCGSSSFCMDGRDGGRDPERGNHPGMSGAAPVPAQRVWA